MSAFRVYDAHGSNRFASVDVPTAQRLLRRAGGARERSAPVAELRRLDPEASNTIDAFAADGTHLAKIGYRPDGEGLFLCG